MTKKGDFLGKNFFSVLSNLDNSDVCNVWVTKDSLGVTHGLIVD